ncbi:amidase [Comamonas sp. Y6]|uniref:Amidase n=1 Tax=Comamonas resistens TaxID=3046670 RepID=A0ABY8SM83_9BURK|nr:amidase [Comamonas resistens]MDL5038767.1 amidase [Comamonas resistens]WHS64177.1 amidase [Comamonas resistens]
MLNSLNLTLAQASAAVMAKELSPVELVNAALERVAAREPEVNAFVSVWEESARQQALKAERDIAQGIHHGPLHGIPVALKDLFDVAGKPTSASSRVRAGHRATQNSAVTDALLRGGAILIGKTHTHEFAFGLTTPQTRNPLDPQRTPGGSSGGSAAAVAYGGAWAAMGTDTGGSIRVPAALCGLVGFKPSYGLVSRHGVVPLAWSLDHVGPIARTVEDVSLMFQAIAGFDARDPASRATPVSLLSHPLLANANVDGLRVGIPKNYYSDRVAEPVANAVRQAAVYLRQRGATLVEVDIPLADYLIPTQWGLMVAESASVHARNIRRDATLYGEDVRTLLETGQLLPATDYLKAQRARQFITAHWQTLFAQIDIVLAPTVPQTAALVTEENFVWPDGSHESVAEAYVRFCAPANVTGLPALTVPYGKDPQGMPVGVQILGKGLDDATVLRVGRVIEEGQSLFHPSDETTNEHAAS